MTTPARLLIVLAVVGLGTRAALPDDRPKPNEPSPGDLVAAWRSAETDERPVLMAEIRRLGAVCVSAIDDLLDDSDTRPSDHLALERLRRDLVDAWHHENLPAGMVYVPAGSLDVPRREAPWGPSGERVHVDAFYIDKHEVTVGQWRAWLAYRERQADSRFGRRIHVPKKDVPASHPVTRITWDEASEFARVYRGGRLPRGEEFERAVRGSGVATWPWGSAGVFGRANLRGYGDGSALPVGSYPRGASPFGALDLVGNVAEWSATLRDSAGSVSRRPYYFGGSFRDHPDPGMTWRSTRRRHWADGTATRRDWVGFRVVRDVPPLPQANRPGPNADEPSGGG